eukprot:387138-Rhodomonas_salina.1
MLHFFGGGGSRKPLNPHTAATSMMDVVDLPVQQSTPAKQSLLPGWNSKLALLSWPLEQTSVYAYHPKPCPAPVDAPALLNIIWPSWGQDSYHRYQPASWDPKGGKLFSAGVTAESIVTSRESRPRSSRARERLLKSRGSRVEDRGKRVQSRESRVESRGPVDGSECRVSGRGMRVENTGSRFEVLGSNTGAIGESPASRVENQESRIYDRGSP